ncbi:MAG: NADP oxidoreductase [Nitrososphaerota archaeon]|jgi:NAD-reducing hydrogenase small subunit|nr:NADP oxidoreductase [Nitrososphaerota archaeon]
MSITPTSNNSGSKVRVATVWLSGCSGCHMSFLDQDERIVDLAKKIQVVYGPLVDAKDFPENIAVTLIEGSVANVEQLELLKEIRGKTHVLISLGDCAVTGNVTALRNSWENSDQVVLERAYKSPENLQATVPNMVPKLLIKTKPLHEIVKIDFYIPGCPPSADLINYVLTELLAGKTPNMEGKAKYG